MWRMNYLLIMPLALLLAGCGGVSSGKDDVPEAQCSVSNQAAKKDHVIFRVLALPGRHPPGDVPYLAGTMNGWHPGDSNWALQENCDGSWQIEAPFKRSGDVHQFKFTRGNWDKVEIDADGYDVPNRTLMWDGEQTLATFTVAHWADLEGGSKGKAPTMTRTPPFSPLAFSTLALLDTRAVRR